MLKQIPISLTNLTEFSRVREPVSAGIPIPFEAAVTTPDLLALSDDQNQPVACQATPLAWWPGKERIKWALLHFQADVPPKSTRTYCLRLKQTQTENPAPSRPDIAAADSKQNCTSVAIDTGKLKAGFAVNQQPSLFGSGLELLTLNDALLAAGPVQVLKLDENGTERAVVCLKGQFVDAKKAPAGYAYTYRIEFYRNHAFVRLFSTITCTGGGAPIKDAAWVIPNTSGKAAIYNSRLEVALESEPDEPEEELSILQDSADQCVYSHNHNSFTKNERFQGWIHSSHVSAAVRFFWQMFPKSLEANGRELRIGLLPQKSPFKDGNGSEANARHYHLEAGESRTHELIFCFHEQGSDIKELNKVFLGLHDAMIPTAPWQWYVDSGTLGDLTVRDPQAYPEFEQMVDRSLEMLLGRRKNLKLYGDRDFGDDLLRAPDIWNNCEYDYPHVGMLMFLRGSGDGWYHQFALPAARHMINIDIANAGPTAGMVYPHSPGHNSDDPKLGSHSWLQGLLEYHVFSGDYLAREVAENTARLWCRGIFASEELYGTERALAWPLIAMLACYQVFAEPEYLKAAQKLKDRIVSLFNHELGHFEGCMKRELYPPSYWQVFLIGSPVLESLVMYDQMFPDEAVRSVIVAIAKRLARINWIAELGVWEYPLPSWVKRPARNHTPKNDRMVSPGVGYAYLYSGDRELWEKAVTAFSNRYDQIDQDGKTMTQSLRFGVRMPAVMAKAEAAEGCRGS
ncbi:MAG: hypothetical protein QM399_04270 [Bacillota bacterium]|nr:hypothetical protein [Bacillota bacterium]